MSSALTQATTRFGRINLTRPVYAVLEGHVDLIVGNAHHIKNVPGRKTDVKDTKWVARLVPHGLAAKSFVPPPAIRDLVRHRRTVYATTRGVGMSKARHACCATASCAAASPPSSCHRGRSTGICATSSPG